jgi:hypothetical protein
MRQHHALIFWALMLLFCGSLGAQEKVGSEVDIHKNVKLIEMGTPQNMAEELKSKYEKFLPLFVETLKENTSEQPSESALTFRIVPAVKEIGSAKTKRVFAKITAYRKNARSEYVGSLLLHSYATGEPVSKEEIGQFLTKQILGPLGVS